MKFAPYTSGKLRKLKVGLSSDPAHDTTTSLEVLGGANIVGIVSATSIFISTTTATSDFANLNISGVSTFSGAIDANSGLDVTGQTELDNLNVSSGSTFSNLNVTGFSTFNSVTRFKGQVLFDNDVTLGNANDDNISFTGRINTDLVPMSNGDRDLGLTSRRWRELHIKNILQSGGGISTFTNDVIFNSNVSIAGTLTYEDVTNIDSVGLITARSGIRVSGGGLTITGVSTFNDDIVGDTATNISGINSVTATKYFGDGSSLTGIDATSLKDTNGAIRVQATTSGAVITGIATASTYNGDLIIGTPTGGFKTGAFTITSTDKTKDSINELNNILGKLVPSPPDTINGQSISLTGTAGVGRLCAGFTPTNNTGGSAPVAGTQYTRNTDSTVSTNFLTEFGPGDSGTVTGFVNAVGVGTTTLSTGNNDGTYGSIQIANNEDASNSTRNTGIASGFYQIYDLRMVNGASPDGFNLAKFTQGSSTTGSVFWYEDPSTVGAPVISFGAVNLPASPTLSYSSGIPHYTESTNNNFTYVMTVTNATGDMYTQNSFVNSDGQTGAFQNPGDKSYTNFASGTNPPARNYGVGTGVTTLITQTPRNLHATVTSNIFTSFDASTPYGSHNNQRVGFTTDFNIMGTTADFTNNVDEDAIECTVGSLTGGSATRVPAISGADNPSQSGASYSWGGGSAGSIATYEATVRGGDLRHDQTDYSTGYLPVGPNYSASRSGSQYFQFQFIQSSISEFQISYTGSLAGCWVCMPDNSTWTTSLSGVNGWADMFQAYKGSGVPTTAEPGCSSGGVMDTNGGTFTCVFGTESSSNDSNNRVLIRFKLTSGNSISDISLSDT